MKCPKCGSEMALHYAEGAPHGDAQSTSGIVRLRYNTHYHCYQCGHEEKVGGEKR